MSRIGLKQGAALLLAPLTLMTWSPAAAISPGQIETALRTESDAELNAFYRFGQHRPVWTHGASLRPEAFQLVALLRDSHLDGFDAGPARAEVLQHAVERAQAGAPGDLARAEVLLSSAWIDYVQALRRPADVGITYIDPSLRPTVPTGRAILDAAVAAPSLSAHLEQVSSLNPVYARLRQGYAELKARSGALPADVEQRLRLNLDRARALPMGGRGRFVLVDAASARLYLYEDGEVRGSMKVIVGKPTEQTPMIAGLIRTAVLNPYWNVPTDLVQRRIAPAVLKEGAGYLKAKRYEILSDWSDGAERVDPATVDWAAVAAGETELRVRQLPGADNSMGAVKFMFPNQFGVYLHDTPDKQLFADETRTLSSGCVRLEDAARLAAWLFGEAPKTGTKDAEQAVALAQPVPVFINYFTADWAGTQFALREDPYGRDLDGRTASIQRLAAR